jgi:hypothetical protein
MRKTDNPQRMANKTKTNLLGRSNHNFLPLGLSSSITGSSIARKRQEMPRSLRQRARRLLRRKERRRLLHPRRRLLHPRRRLLRHQRRKKRLLFPLSRRSQWKKSVRRSPLPPLLPVKSLS